MAMQAVQQFTTRGQMTPRLAQQIRLLGLSTQDLELEIRQWLDNNVMLEVDADEPEVTDDSDVDAGDELDLDSNWDDAYTPMAGTAQQAFDGAPQLAAAEAEAPMDILVRDLPLECHSAEQLQASFAILEHVDERGWLEHDLPHIAAASGHAPGALVSALALIRRIAPPGFAARSLEECFLLQLEAMPQDNSVAAARKLIGLGLERLARRELEQVRRAARLDAETFAAALQLLRKLDPHPGKASIEAPAVLPDVVVARIDQRWTVTLSEFAAPRLRINGDYVRALERSGNSGSAMRRQLTEARWLLRGLEQRADTLLRVAHAVFARQFAFLEGGDEALQPLTLRDIAAEVGVHESTVSRVTSAKYALTPRGVFELKHFFTGSYGTESQASHAAARAMVRRLIAAEDSDTPLDDAAIARVLAERGIQLARRTVAKYREGMGIPPARLRGVTQLALTA